MEAARTSETSVDNYFSRQYITEDNSEINIIYYANYAHTNLNNNLWCREIVKYIIPVGSHVRKGW
jgi:hypothetical protein